MTGNKIIVWEADSREIANNLVDLIVNDGFLSYKNEYALLWQDETTREVQTVFDDLQTLQLKYQLMEPKTPRCIINRNQIIQSNKKVHRLTDHEQHYPYGDYGYSQHYVEPYIEWTIVV